MKRTGLRNKENIMNEVKKKFHFQPSKEQNSKSRMHLKNRSQNISQKGGSCTFSTVKAENHESNDGNDSSWLSKLVSNIQEQNPQVSPHQLNQDKKVMKKNENEKKVKEVPVTRNTSLGSIFSNDRKNSQTLRSKKSLTKGMIKKAKKYENSKISTSQLYQAVENKCMKKSESQIKPIRKINVEKSEKKQTKDEKISIHNYSTIKNEENDELLKEKPPQKINEPQIRKQQKKNIDYKINENTVITTPIQRVGSIRRNKGKISSNMKPLPTLEDFSAVTIKKQVDENTKQCQLRRKYCEKTDEVNKENQVYRQNKILNKYSQYDKYTFQRQKYNKYSKRPYKYNQNLQNVDRNQQDSSKKGIRKNSAPLNEPKKQPVNRFTPLFPEMTDLSHPNKNPYLEMPSIPLQDGHQVQEKKKQDNLGQLLDNINKKLSMYIQKNHLSAEEQRLELEFCELRKY